MSQDLVRVEIQGTLESVPKKNDASPEGDFVRAGGLRIRLEFPKTEGRPKTLDDLIGQRVSVQGALRRGQTPDDLICDVEGAVAAVGALEFLVGYEPERVAEVEALSRSLGFKIRDRYQPGKYLVITGGSKAVAGLDKLKKAKGVRYVEANQVVRIPPGESPTRPRVPR